jgi:hypothetical protein
MEKYLELLGFLARDKITGFKGVATSIGFDLYGCVQAVITPSIGADGKIGESLWFDIERLEKIGEQPVMAAPSFADPQ